MSDQERDRKVNDEDTADDVEAHQKARLANEEASDDEGEDDVEGHMKSGRL